MASEVFLSLLANVAQWYKKEWETKGVIFRCGGFPNVPLIGTHGCINYNLVLLKRQLGNVKVSPIKDEDLMPFILNDVDRLNPTVRIARRDWTRIIRIDQEWGKKNVIAKELYTLWEKERAQIIKMPFFFESSSFPQML